MKKFINVFFGIIITLTIVFFIIECLISEGDDIFGKQMVIIFALMFIGFLLIAEFGLYYNCIYFFTQKNKQVWKTLYNVLMLIISCTMLVSIYGMLFWTLRLWETLVFVLAVVAIVLWIVYALLCVWKMLDIQ